MTIWIIKWLWRGYMVAALVVALCALVGLSVNRTPSLVGSLSQQSPDAQMPKILWYCLVKGVFWPMAIREVGSSRQMSLMDWFFNRYDPWAGQLPARISKLSSPCSQADDQTVS